MSDSAAAKSEIDAANSGEAKPQRSWNFLLTGKWLAALIVGSLVIHSAVFILVRKSATKANPPQAEYTIGTFSFEASEPGEARGTTGKFDLHIRFIDDLDALARQRAATHQFRVREGVEGLLRKSKGLELDDSAVGRLKHEIQKRIDDAIDLQAVAEVIITDMNFVAARADPVPHLETTSTSIENKSAEIKPVTNKAAERERTGIQTTDSKSFTKPNPTEPTTEVSGEARQWPTSEKPAPQAVPAQPPDPPNSANSAVHETSPSDDPPADAESLKSPVANDSNLPQTKRSESAAAKTEW